MMLRVSRISPLFRNGVSVTSAPAQQRQLSFEFTDQQKQFRDAALKFAKEVIIPKAAEHDRTGEFPWKIVKQAHANGFANPGIPTKYGKPFI